MNRLLLIIFGLAMTEFAFAQSDYDDNIDAARNGDAEAQVIIGCCYENGLGVVKDYSQAVFWYRKAAEQGATYAQFVLGYCYEIGRGVTKDLSQAVYWFCEAAKQGDSDAQYELGFCYMWGEGIIKDLLLASYWFQRAAAQGNAKAKAALAQAELMMEKEQLNYSYYSESTDSVAMYKKVKALYEIFLFEGADVGTEDEFFKWFFTRGEKGYSNRKDVFDAFHADNDYYVGNNYEDFKKFLGLHAVEEHTVSEVDTDLITTQFENKNTFAIIIGNENYKNNVDVPYANNDAKIFADYVVKTLGVPQEQVRLIENAGYNDIRMAVNWLIQAMTVFRGKGRAIVYYAGHGIPNESDLSSYLLPVDGIGSDPGSAYSLQELFDKLGGVEAQSVAIFLDACFSGSKREEGMLTAARGVAIKVKQVAPKGNLIVFSAAQGDETTYPYNDKQHGMFTYFLLKKLQESKGEVTLGELGDYLTEEVGRQSFVKNGKMQTPTVKVASSLQGSWREMKLK